MDEIKAFDPQQLIFLNEEWIALGEAKISVLDRGFLFGDGVYEVIPVYARHPFRLLQHIERLNNSLAAISLANPYDSNTWQAIIWQAIACQAAENQWVYIQITRGAAPRDLAFPSRETASTVMVMSNPLVTPSPAIQKAGVSAITAIDNRWGRCDIKSISLLANVLLRQLSAAEGHNETILLREGFLTEGSASSVFIVQNGVLLAPPKSTHILPSITYDVILELAEQHQIPYSIRPISEAELRHADEIWLTSSPKEILKVNQLDGQPIGQNTRSALYPKMLRYYQQFKREQILATENDIEDDDD